MRMDDEPRESRHMHVHARPEPTARKAPGSPEIARAVADAIQRYPNLSPARIVSMLNRQGVKNVTEDEVRYVIGGRK